MDSKIMLIAVIAIMTSCCVDTTEETRPLENNSFIRTTAENIFKNPALYEGKQVVITSKKFNLYLDTATFESRRYDPETKLLVWTYPVYQIYGLKDTISIGNQSKMIVYDYNKEWVFLSEKIMQDPYLIKETSQATEKFYNDVYFDFYGVIELEPFCTCQSEEYGFIDPWNNLNTIRENISRVACRSTAVGSCWDVWLHEQDILKRDCFGYFDNKSLEEMDEYITKGSKAVYHGFSHRITDQTKDYFFDENGNPKNSELRIKNIEGENYFFPTFSCKPGSEVKIPIMKFIDAKIINNSTTKWNLAKVDCYDLHPFKGNGRPMTRCKNIPYKET
jgi:hypothetical protein